MQFLKFCISFASIYYTKQYNAKSSRLASKCFRIKILSWHLFAKRNCCTGIGYKNDLAIMRLKFSFHANLATMLCVRESLKTGRTDLGRNVKVSI